MQSAAGFAAGVKCVASPTECAAASVAHSDKSRAGAIAGVTGDRVPVACDEGYDGSGVRSRSPAAVRRRSQDSVALPDSLAPSCRGSPHIPPVLRG